MSNNDTQHPISDIIARLRMYMIVPNLNMNDYGKIEDKLFKAYVPTVDMTKTDRSRHLFQIVAGVKDLDEAKKRFVETFKPELAEVDMTYTATIKSLPYDVAQVVKAEVAVREGSKELKGRKFQSTVQLVQELAHSPKIKSCIDWNTALEKTKRQWKIREVNLQGGEILA